MRAAGHRCLSATILLLLMEEYFKIGRLAATHGLQGEIVLQHSLGKKTSLKGLEQLFVEEAPGRFLPYFLEGTRIKNDQEVFLKLEGIHTKEAARKLTPREAWITEKDFHQFAGKSAPISLLGFTLVQDGKELGVIREVIEQPHQVLCTILLGEREALIPLHEDSLEQIDRKKKQVHVQLPDGLLDLYR